MKLWNAIIARNTETLEDRMFAENALPKGWRFILATQISMPVDTDKPDENPIPPEGMAVKGTNKTDK